MIIVSNLATQNAHSFSRPGPLPDDLPKNAAPAAVAAAAVVVAATAIVVVVAAAVAATTAIAEAMNFHGLVSFASLLVFSASLACRLRT